MNQTKGNKCSRFFALLLAGVLSVASLSAQAQNRTIKGCITDANNKEPLMGATITLDGGKTGAVTDLDGNYTLIVPAGTKQITVSYIGYIAKTVQLKGDVINITLDSNDRQLGEVVVVGYGTARKSDLTGSVATVSALFRRLSSSSMARFRVFRSCRTPVRHRQVALFAYVVVLH